MTPRNILVITISALLLAIAIAPAGASEITIKVTPQADGVNVPIHAPITLTGAQAKADPQNFTVTVKCAEGKTTPGQIVNGDNGKELWWIAPSVQAGKTVTCTATLTEGKTKSKNVFSFKETPGKHFDVLLNGKPVTRYMCERDTTDETTKHNTYKVYNHVFDETGEKFLTKGAGGKFTHHRGIYIGFSRTTAGGKKFDTWHMRNNIQKHVKIACKTAGPVLARYTAIISWNEGEDKPIITEQREITLYNQGDSAIMLMDFRTKLTGARGDTILDGDPEHAGCQYRPHNDVAGNKSAKYLFHKDGLNLKKDKDLPWAALTYKLNDKQYHVQHMSGPGIPKGNTYSAYRDYGRFGAYFKKPVAKGETLELRYRFYVAKGDMPDRKEFANRYAAFATPPKVEVTK